MANHSSRTRLLDLESALPPSFWTEGTTATIHVRRVRPGRLEVLDNEEAEAFLSGSGSLPVSRRGWLELLEIRLSFEVEENVHGVKPRGSYYRCPVDRAGRLDLPLLAATRALPDAEREAKMAWLPNKSEHALLTRSLFRCLQEIARRELDPTWLLDLPFLGAVVVEPPRPERAPQRDRAPPGSRSRKGSRGQSPSGARSPPVRRVRPSRRAPPLA